MTDNVATQIGIDLGTSNCCVAAYRNGHLLQPVILRNALGEAITPSYVGFHDDGRIFGRHAKESSSQKPADTIFSIKRVIGKRIDDPEVLEMSQCWPFTLVNREGQVAVKVTEQDEDKLFAPEEISAMLLGHLKASVEHALGFPVDKAVITVPANFTDSQRRATKQAGESAGWNVIGIMNEPTAAAVAYGLHTIGEKTILVFDFGGGTLDVSILKIVDGREFEVITTSGNMHLGGDDFDERIIQKLKRDFEDEHGIHLEEELEEEQLRGAMHKLREKAEKG